MENYQLVFRLRDLAAIKICKNLWRLPSTRQWVKVCLKEKDFSLKAQVTAYIKEFDITKKIDKLALSEELNRELTSAFESMGYKIFHWLHKHKHDNFTMAALQLCVDHIHWTKNGFIDTSKTLRGVYNSKKLSDNYNIWLMLSYRCLEDCIRDLWPKLNRNALKKIRKLPAGKFMLPEMLRFYWLYRMTGDEHKESAVLYKAFCYHEVSYNKEISIEENMLVFSVLGCNYDAVKYFWKLYNDDQKTNAISNLSMIPDYYLPIAVNCTYAGEGNREDSTQIVMFLVQQFLNYGMDEALYYLLHETTLLKKLMFWPWLDLFVRIIEAPEKYHGIIHYRLIIPGMLSSLEKNDVNTNDLKLHTIFYKIWKSNPDNFKKDINYRDLVHKYLVEENIVILKLVMNDEYFRVQREALLADIFYVLSSWSIDKKDFVNKFIGEVLVCEEERDRLKLHISNYQEKHFTLGPQFTPLLRPKKFYNLFLPIRR